MFTLYQKAFSADMKTYPVYYGQQWYRTGTCRSHIEHRAGAVGRQGLVN